MFKNVLIGVCFGVCLMMIIGAIVKKDESNERYKMYVPNQGEGIVFVLDSHTGQFSLYMPEYVYEYDSGKRIMSNYILVDKIQNEAEMIKRKKDIDEKILEKEKRSEAPVPAPAIVR